MSVTTSATSNCESINEDFIGSGSSVAPTPVVSANNQKPKYESLLFNHEMARFAILRGLDIHRSVVV